jgi:superfamily II DNA or RNA helicase
MQTSHEAIASRIDAEVAQHESQKEHRATAERQRAYYEAKAREAAETIAAIDAAMTGEPADVDVAQTSIELSPKILPSDVVLLAQAVKSHQLRIEYQRPDYDNIELAFERVRRVLYVAFMGSGKTVLAAALIRVWASRGERILIVCPTREILRQTDRKLISAGLTKDQIGWIWQRGIDRFRGRNGSWVNEPRENAEAPVQLASLDTLRRRSMPKGITRIVIDEAHHAPATKWRKVLAWYPDAWVLGLTGTPVHGGHPLVGNHNDCFDELVQCHLSTEQLIAGGFIDRPTFWTPEWSAPLTRWAGREFTPKEAAELMRGQFVLQTIWEEFKKHGVSPALGYAATRKEAKKYAKAGTATGYSSATLFGTDSDSDRTEKLAKLRAGEIKVLWTCDVLSEGWDFAGLRCVLLARPTLSIAKYLQQVARCMRSGLLPPVVLDLWGAWRVFDPPWADQKWYLARKQRTRSHVGERTANGTVVWTARTIGIDGHLVRGNTIQRQTVCAGRGTYSSQTNTYSLLCPDNAKPSLLAFCPSVMVRRKNRPWQCHPCAHNVIRAEVTKCSGPESGGECPDNAVSSRHYMLPSRVRKRSGRPWRCHPCTVGRSAAPTACHGYGDYACPNNAMSPRWACTPYRVRQRNNAPWICKSCSLKQQQSRPRHNGRFTSNEAK